MLKESDDAKNLLELQMKVAVMTDTNSGISVDEGKALGLTVIPMPVIVDGKSYLEHEEISHTELYAFMREHKDVSTSQPSPQVLCDTWDELLSQGYDEIVYVPMSSGLSSSCDTATAMANNYDGKVFVTDDHRISVTLRQSVLDALHLANSGKSGSEIKRILDENAYNSSIYITVDSMEYLLKNGRATKAAAMIATVLNIKPVLTIQGEKLDAFKKVRGMKKSIGVMIDAIAHDVKKRFKGVPHELLPIGTAGTLETQEEIDFWCNSVREAFPGHEVYYNPLSCSIACHVGIGAIGLGIAKKIIV